MCGRFTLQIHPELLAEIFGLQELPIFPARYNIAPTQQIPVIRQDAEGHNRLDFLRWGLIPTWAKDLSVGSHMINARAESITEKPAFRHAIRYRRCIIPASGFFEWRHEDKKAIPLYVRMKDGAPMCFAGIWEQWKSPEEEIVESCAMLTTSSNRLIEPLHDRMPVILHPDNYDLWLNRNMHDPEQLKHLYQPYPADSMEMYPVSPLVNSPHNDLPDLISPLNPPAETAKKA